MLKRFGQIVLWKYAGDTSVEKLYRHHRLARVVGHAFVISLGLTISLVVDLMLARGNRPDIAVVFGLIASLVAVVSMLLLIPAIAWAEEIEKELQIRGHPQPKESVVLEKRIVKVSLRMVFWIAVGMVAASVLR